MFSGFIEEPRNSDLHEFTLKNYFTMCYANRFEKGAKEMEKYAIEYYSCRIKYFCLLYELGSYKVESIQNWKKKFPILPNVKFEH